MMLPVRAVETAGDGSVSNDLTSMMSSLTDLNTLADGQEAESPLIAPVNLYGRSKETLLLQRTFMKMRASQTAQLVILHGESGSGKTALVDSLRMPVFDSSGYFCAGKYFQNSGVRDPYSAIMTAFSDLCDLLVQCTNFNEARRQEIQQALGTDGPVLAKAISSLNSILKLSDHQNYSGGSSMKNEAVFALFKAACKRFLSVMSSDQNPVVVFIDDIQWMDEGSRQLLQSLIRDTELKNVMLILSYREENADTVATFVDAATTGPDTYRVVDIHLQNLDVDGVHLLVSDILGGSSPKVRQLSELVSQKTIGNCFYVHQFIESIQREELLIKESDGWKYDVEEIRQETSVSNNLADILSRKMQRLPPEMVDTFKIASLLGYQFDEYMVVQVISAALADSSDLGLSTSSLNKDISEVSTVVSSLFKGVNTGFVEKVNDHYQFCHDKVQAACQATMDNEEQANLHRLIAETYLASLGEPEVSEDEVAISNYHAAIHYHQAGVPPDEFAKVRLSRLNLAAATFCIQKSAFIDADELLRRALDLLDSNRMWDDQFDLAFELTETLARMELVLGNVAECKVLSGQAMAHAKTIEMKISPMLVDCEARMADGQVEESTVACNAALAILGVNLPSEICKRHVVFKFLKVRRLIGKKSDKALLSIPLLNDERVATIVRFLFYTSTYFSLCEKPNETAYYALMATELSFRLGLSPFSASAVGIYAVAECTMKNFKRADRFGKLALKLSEKLQCAEAAIPTIVMVETLALHWRKSIEETIIDLDRGIRVGMETGDMVYSVYGFSNACAARLMSGMSLPKLEEYILYNYYQFGEIGENAMFRWSMPIAQFTLNLQTSGASVRDVVALNGEMMQEAEFRRHVRESDNSVLWWLLLFFKLQLTFHFGFYSLAGSVFKEMIVLSEAPLNHYNIHPWFCYGALAHIEMHRLLGKSSYLRVARRYHNLLKRKSDCPNARPYIAILNAEMMTVKKGADWNSIMQSYQEAIEIAAELGYCHLEALCNERAAFYQSSQRLHVDAKPYFDRALHLYRNEWGATAKYEWLSNQIEAISVTPEESGGISFVGAYINVAEESQVS